MEESKKSQSQSADGELVCPQCARRYEGDERFCDSCGMPLILTGSTAPDPARERARKIDPRYAQGEPLKVAFTRNQAESDLVQNILLEEGVPSIARRSRGFDVPDFLAAGPRDVLVPESGAEFARALLRQANVAETVDAAPARVFQPWILVAVLGGGLLASLAAWLLGGGAS